MTLTLPVRVTYHQAAHYTKGRNSRVRAIVNHRMVGTVAGTRAYFTNPDTRPVSTHFGIGIINGKLVIDQYVPLDDTAYGNGNYDVTGVWDDWGYPLSNINAQTLNIEHQDHGDPAGKGVVPEIVQQASIALQALLLRGSAADWKLAGIVLRDWDNATILQRELGNIVPGPRTLITHNDIAGRLKPYCWKPWMSDKIGFPRTKYVDGVRSLIAAPVPTPPPTGDDMPAFSAPLVPTSVQIAATSWLYIKPDFAPDAGNVQISTDRWMPLVGTTATSAIVSYVGSDGKNTGKTYYVKPAAVKATKPVVTTTDCTAAVTAATTPLKAQITTLTAENSTLKVQVTKDAARITGIKAKAAASNADIQND